MDIKGMHYDFKQKLNKVDSQQYRNFRVPEIDWSLNEAYELYIKSVAQPRQHNNLGFETSQRSIDDIRALVVNDKEIIPTLEADGTYFITLPVDYMFYLSSTVLIKKSTCGVRNARGILIQHDDLSLENSFYNSSYEWKEVNIRFYEKGIKLFTDSTFTIEKVKLNYIRKQKYIHNAQDFLPSQTYNLPNGTVLSGTQDCELPEHTHREIVDLAILITTGNLQIPDYQIKQAKINLNN
jgi:hypothetical protein